MKCGIYAIKNKVNGKMYIGQSRNIENRYKDHCRELKNNQHYNKHLQASYNKYGMSEFYITVLEECDIEILGPKEQQWVSSVSRKELYNQVFDVQHRQGESNPFFGKKHTESTKTAMSEAKKDIYIGSGNPNYGKKHSASALIRISEGRGKLDKDQVLQIAVLLKTGHSHQDIADKYEISRSVVTRISNGSRWANVTGGPVIPVVYIDGKRKFGELHCKRIGDKTRQCKRRNKL